MQCPLRFKEEIMTTKEIYWNLPNQGVGFYKIMQEQNKLILTEANLMIVLGELMKGLNDGISADSLALENVTDNLNKLNVIDKGLSTFGMLSMIASGGLITLSSMAVEAEAGEDASMITKTANYINKGAQNMGSVKMKLLLGGLRGAISSGIIISILQSYCSVSQGSDNSAIQRLKAFSGGQEEDIKLVAGSESRSSQTIQSITKSDKDAIQNEYSAKTQQINYN